MRLSLVAACVLMLAGCAHTVTLIELASAIPAHEATWVPTPGEEMAGPLAEMKARAESWGFRFEPLPPGMGDTWGRISVPSRVVQVRDGLPVNAQFEVIAHELGHIFGPVSLAPDASQVFAEMVAVGVAEYYGHVGYVNTSAKYVAMHKGGFHVAKYVEVDVKFAVRCITGREKFALMR